MSTILKVRVSHLPVNPRMRLTDVNGVRLVLGDGTRAAIRELEGYLWTWDIAVHNGHRQKKRSLRCLVDEVADKTSDDILLKTPTQVVNRLLGDRQEWSVAEVANLLLCTVEHVYALLASKALRRCSKRGEPARVSRESLEAFLYNRLVNK
jgi:hypothetical protein